VALAAGHIGPAFARWLDAYAARRSSETAVVILEPAPDTSTPLRSS